MKSNSLIAIAAIHTGILNTRGTAASNRMRDLPPFLTFQPYSAASLLLIFAILPLSLAAATRPVTTLADSGPGSLREAIAASASGDTITFAITGTIFLTSGELVVGRNLTILGPKAAKVAVSGSSLSRVFNIVGGTVSIADLTIMDGYVIGAPGQSAQGGGIMNQGTLHMANCAIWRNFAVGGNGDDTVTSGGEAIGGGIWNGGALSLVNCTIADNWTHGGHGAHGFGFNNPGNGGTGCGGGIANSGDLAHCVPVNCTMSRNAAAGGRGGTSTLGRGGTGGDSAGGGLHSRLATFVVHNTLLAGNSSHAGPGGPGFPDGSNGTAIGPNVETIVTSLGHNLVGSTDGSTGWIASDLTGTASAPLEPRLGPMRFNGGPTLTMALAPDSGAVDAGDDAVVRPPTSLATDQRGWPRLSGTHVDIGAYEVLECNGVAPAGLLGWWPGGGNANDIAGGHNGTPENGATFTAGMVGTGFTFDGVDDRVAVPSFNLPQTEITVEFWQKADAVANQSTFSLSTFNAAAVFNAHVPYGDGKVYWDFGDINNGGRLVYEPSPEDSLVGSWQHFAMVASLSGNYMRIYRNGKEVASKHGMTLFPNSGHLDLMIGGLSSVPFGGVIDELSIYDRALSEIEIREIYLAGSAGKCVVPCSITDVTRSANNVTLSWRSQPGLRYRVQYNADLTAGEWLDVPGDVTAGGFTPSKTDSLATGTARFYRVELFR